LPGDSLPEPEVEAFVPNTDELEGGNVASSCRPVKVSADELAEDQRCYVEMAETLDL